MTGTKSEMAFVKFTKKEFFLLLEDAITAKYPYLLKDHKWEWEDITIASCIEGNNFPDDKIAIELIFTKHEEPLDKPCPCAVNSVCR